MQLLEAEPWPGSIMPTSMWKLEAGPELESTAAGDELTWKAVACKLSMACRSNEIGSKEGKRDWEGMLGVNPIVFRKYSDPLNGLALRKCVSEQQDQRWHRTLPPSEMLPRGEALGGYIFVCNNDTMQEDLRRQLFGLPPKYKDSVRAITPGLPLFLYNYTAHQLHGVFEAASFGGSNIDPTAWEDKKCRGESRFPAQVRIRVKKVCKPLEEDSFRPILHHYDGPKFRLQLSVPEALALLDLFMNDLT